MNHPHTTSQYTGILALAAIGCLCTMPLQSADVEDDFERPDTLWSGSAAEGVGPEYKLIQASGERPALVALLDGRVAFDQETVGGAEVAGDVALVRSDVELEVPFVIEGTVQTAGIEAVSILYGLAFHVQEDGSGYALRINTGNHGTPLQLIRFQPDEKGREVDKLPNSSLISLSSDYRLRVACEDPCFIKVSLTGPGIDGALEAEFDLRRRPPVLDGGKAGFYTNTPKKNVTFDDLVIRTGGSAAP